MHQCLVFKGCAAVAEVAVCCGSCPYPVQGMFGACAHIGEVASAKNRKDASVIRGCNKTITLLKYYYNCRAALAPVVSKCGFQIKSMTQPAVIYRRAERRSVF